VVTSTTNNSASGGDGARRERPDRRIRRLYLVALLLIAALVVAMQWAEHLARRQTQDAATVINLAGRQRMLSQRVAKSALAISSTEDRSEIFRHAVELEESLEEIQRVHAGLLEGNEDLGLPGDPPPAIAAMFERLEPTFDALTQAASRVLEETRGYDMDALSDERTQRALATLLEQGDAFLTQMNQIVFAWAEHTGREHVLFQRAELALTALLLLALLLEGVFIFEPAARTIGAHVAALREARREAEEANLAKSQFLANMSHEIRTPMAAVLGYADVLASEQTPPGERQEAATILRRNGEHLLAIINDILDVSRLEAGMLRIDPTDCAPLEVLEEVRSLMAGRASQAGLDLVVERIYPLPRTIRTDPLRLRQILINLVGNAVKFTERGEVRVRVDSLRGPDDSVALRFIVADTGVGIDAEVLPALFSMFTQVDSSATRRFGGTGLGLAISQHLACLLGGRIAVCSEKGVGSVFTLVLEAGRIEADRMLTEDAAPSSERATAPSERPARSEAEASLAGARILLAEDGVDNQRLISHCLKKAGAEVVVVEHGRAAVERIDAAERAGEAFDVILMDMQMPEMDGYAATRSLREDGCDTPIIALTAHAMKGDREACLEAGCDDYATKPVRRDALVELVDAHIERRRLDAERDDRRDAA